MFNRRLRVPVFAALATALAVTPALAQTPDEANQGILAPWIPLDLVLGSSPEGRRESDPFSIGSNTYRLFVRDTGVTTARGPHDRVCVDRLVTNSQNEVHRLAISTTSSAPDGRRHFRWTRGSRVPEVTCELLPPADAYRVWSLAPPGTTITPQWASWRAPAVFDSFEPMLEQDDADQAMRRNIDRMIESQKLDGVCLEISVIRAPFHSPDGVLGWMMWFEIFEAISNRMRQTLGSGSRDLSPGDAGYVQIDRGVVRSRFPVGNRDDVGRYRRIADLPTLNGYSQLHTIGFMTNEDIETYLTALPLDPEKLPVQMVSGGCFGQPIAYRADASTPEVELYALVRISVVAPYWIQYPEADAEARQFWQTFNDRLFRHELVHVYDQIAVANEAVFSARGHVDLKEQLPLSWRDSPGTPWGRFAGRYGLGNNISPHVFFTPFIEGVLGGEPASIGYFHNAVYGVDSNGQRTTRLDIDLRTPVAFEYGDEAARRWTESTIIQKWVAPGGAAN